jgi:hypothetical protein
MILKAGPPSALALLLLAGPAAAHHSDSVFNRGLVRTVSGVVEEFAIINPHSWLEIVAKDDQGTEQKWSFQTAGPDQLNRAGWKAHPVLPGEAVKARFHPSDDGSRRGELISLTLPDGQVLEAGVAAGAEKPLP